MKRKDATQRRVVARTKPDDVAPLIAEVRQLIQSARSAAASAVNILRLLSRICG